MSGPVLVIELAEAVPRVAIHPVLAEARDALSAHYGGGTRATGRDPADRTSTPPQPSLRHRGDR